MADKPSAEVRIDEGLVASLAAQVPFELRGPARKAAEGWDSELWRVGDAVALRLPRRAASAALVAHEQQALPLVGPRIEATGVRVPIPLFVGDPVADYPWSWSVVPWFSGTPAMGTDRAARGAWAGALARALRALHVPAPAEHPVNPFRGVPLSQRADAVRQRLEMLQGTPHVGVARNIWAAGLDAGRWSEAPVWIHGDLHPGNLLVHEGALAAVIDFGDVTAGDPAYDLAIAWLAFDAAGRELFRVAYGIAREDETWRRARAWAAAVAVTLLAHSDDAPEYGALGRDALRELDAS